jgi:hypothetical protein
MADLKEQPVYMQFCLKLGKHAMENFDMLKIAFGEKNGEGNKLLTGFPTSKAVRPLLKMPIAWYICQQAKQM